MKPIFVAASMDDAVSGDRPELDPSVPVFGSVAMSDVAVQSSDSRNTDRVKSLRPPMGIAAASVCGMLAAVMYTMANIALRQCVGVDPFLVSAVKAAPTVILLGPFLGWMFARGETIATSSRMVPRFVAASLLGQVVGNAAFQIALGVIGLAASVPITLGVLIVGSALLGRVMLHEPVRMRTVVAMGLVIIAVIVLSLPNATESPSTTSLPIWMGALCAAASGAAYAVFGVVMRQALTGGLSASATMFISGMVGTVVLWMITVLRIGIEPLGGITFVEWATMASAGLCNFSAFVALSASLKSLPVVAVNLINASQVAMAGIAGVMLFGEPMTAILLFGIGLTFAGLSVLAGGRRNRVPT
ncbi:MAG: DMT family transporter [Rubripirellula sp.]